MVIKIIYEKSRRAIESRAPRGIFTLCTHLWYLLEARDESCNNMSIRLQVQEMVLELEKRLRREGVVTPQVPAGRDINKIGVEERELLLKVWLFVYV